MKKAEVSVLVTIIISLASFFVVSAAIVNFLNNSDDKAVENACHSSILARAETAIRVGGSDSALMSTSIRTIPAVCKTIDKKIQGDRDKIKKQMAEKVARCWWMFGEGKYEEILSDNVDVSFLPTLFGTGSLDNQCFVCYTMIIDQDKIEPGEGGDCRSNPDNCPIEAREFMQFLYEQPKSLVEQTCKDGSCTACEQKQDCREGEFCYNSQCTPGISYLQYVQSKEGPGQVGLLTNSIKADHAYAITFLPKNRNLEGSTWRGALTSTVGLATAVLGCVASAPICPFVIIAGAGIGAVGASDLAIDIRQSNRVDAPNLEQIFSEREYSSIYISDLTTAQQYCSAGDINGN